MQTIYVEIPKRVGDYKVDTGGQSLAEVTAAGAGLGASLGSIVPGIGNAIGAGIGTVTGAVASLFGFRSGRDEVRDVFRKILANAFGSIMPGKIRFIGSARDIPELADQYAIEDIRAVLRELHRVTLAALEPGTDMYSDIDLAFRSLEFNTTDTSASYLVLKFQATTRAAVDDSPALGKSDDTLTPAGDRSPADRRTNDDANVSTTAGAGRAVLSSPMLAGAAGLALLLILSR